MPINPLRTHTGNGWANVWLGATTENQIEATRRIPHLVAIPAAVRFLSVEPMLEAIDLSPWLGELDWLILTDESGVSNRSRPMHPDWVRDLVRTVGSAVFSDTSRQQPPPVAGG
jgi:protein gp37